MAQEKKELTEAVKNLYEGGFDQQEMLVELQKRGYKSITSIGGLKAKLGRMAQKGIITRDRAGKPKTKKIKIKKVAIKKEIKPELEIVIKQNVTVQLPRELVKRVQFHKINTGKKMHEIFEEAIKEYLNK